MADDAQVVELPPRLDRAEVQRLLRAYPLAESLVGNTVRRGPSGLLHTVQAGDGGVTVSAYDERAGLTVGVAQFAPILVPSADGTHLRPSGALQAWDVHVDAGYRRRGIASEMYDVARLFKLREIAPGGIQTEAGSAFRKAFRGRRGGLAGFIAGMFAR